jgi:hypothetical protein
VIIALQHKAISIRSVPGPIKRVSVGRIGGPIRPLEIIFEVNVIETNPAVLIPGIAETKFGEHTVFLGRV